MEEVPVAGLLGNPPANAGAGDDRRALAQLLVPLNSRLRHRFPRGHYRELCEAVHECHALVGEVRLGKKTADEGGILEADRTVFRLFKLADARSSLDQGSPELMPVESKGGNHANSSDDDSMHPNFLARPFPSLPAVS